MAGGGGVAEVGREAVAYAGPAQSSQGCVQRPPVIVDPQC